jgi:maltokinase
VTVSDHLPQLVVDHLPDHLVRQRWSGAANRAIAEVELVWHDVVREHDPWLLWALARVRFTDGATQDYQLFVGARPAHPEPEFLQGKERELIAVVPDPDGGADLVLYDALVDADLAIDVLHLADPDRVVEVRRPIVLEHSNSSVVFDEAIILKIFRKVEPGPNPDVEITRMLSDHGYEHVLTPLAELVRDGTDLAVLRPFLVGAVEGWHLARTSVRDLLASRDSPEQAGADFAPDAERIGTMLAGLHVVMADTWGREDGDAASWAGEMQAHLDSLGAVAGLDHAAVTARYDALAATGDAGAQIHIHGDLHLAQVLKADTGWLVLDFEGEPARRRSDRYTASSPLRDVAGLLRSFHYAAAVGRADWAADEELDELAVAWEERNRQAFLDAYLAVDGIHALLPTDPSARAIVCAAFELDKAVYEVGYELGHRPEQVDIPLAGIERLVPAAAP